MLMFLGGVAAIVAGSFSYAYGEKYFELRNDVKKIKDQLLKEGVAAKNACILVELRNLSQSLYEKHFFGFHEDCEERYLKSKLRADNYLSNCIDANKRIVEINNEIFLLESSIKSSQMDFVDKLFEHSSSGEFSIKSSVSNIPDEIDVACSGAFTKLKSLKKERDALKPWTIMSPDGYNIRIAKFEEHSGYYGRDEMDSKFYFKGDCFIISNASGYFLKSFKKFCKFYHSEKLPSFRSKFFERIIDHHQSSQSDEFSGHRSFHRMYKREEAKMALIIDTVINPAKLYVEINKQIVEHCREIHNKSNAEFCSLDFSIEESNLDLDTSYISDKIDLYRKEFVLESSKIVKSYS